MPDSQDTSSSDPTTPTFQSDSAAQHDSDPTTPVRKPPAQAAATPKSAPAAAGSRGSGGSSQQRRRADTSLLEDFLLGRPSPQRAAAQKAAQRAAMTYNQQQWRRKSVGILGLGMPQVDKVTAGVRQELRQEMRAAAVRKLQQPGGVRDRVKAWQKANQAAMVAQGGSVPVAEDVRSEPTEIAAHVEAESVTEEDRVRIKWRQKAKKRKIKAEKAEIHQGAEGAEEGTDAQEDEEEDDDEAAEIVVGETQKDPRPRELPKKRIVSDDNWMKRRKGRSPPRNRVKAEGSPTPIPKDFLLRTAQNPSVQSKIKDWATRVEIPEPPAPKIRHYHKRSGGTQAGETDAGETNSPSTATPDDGIRVKPIEPYDDGIRIKPSEPYDDGIRVKPLDLKPKDKDDDGIRIKPMRKKEPPDDGIRVRPMRSDSPASDGIRIRPNYETPIAEPATRTASPRRRTSVERNTRVPSTRRAKSQPDVSRVSEDVSTTIETPTKRKASPKPRSRQKPSPTVVTSTFVTATDKTSDAEDWSEHDSPSRHEESPEGSQIAPTVPGNKSLADIPVGFSAFSELDLPLPFGADARNSAAKKPKGQRNASLKGVPKVIKRVVNGAKEIIQEKVEHSKPVANRPPNIESWLDDTVDPFVERPTNKTAVEEEWAQASQARTAPEASLEEEAQSTIPSAPTTAPPPVPASAPATPVQAPGAASDQENTDPQKETKGPAAKKNKSAGSPSSASLKRSRATRTSSTPFRFGGKKPFREVLKEAFRGESGGHKLPPAVYSSYETAEYESESDSRDDDIESEVQESRRRSDGPTKRSPSPEPLSTVSSEDSELKPSAPSRKKPPTNGHHALSTIVSEQPSSTRESDTISTVSQTTVTQDTTVFTRSTDVSRQRSQKSGLKRRLTKHSDLISVLSLPDNPDNDRLVSAKRSGSIRSSRSLHRRPSRLDKSSFDELLQEFADDESFYRRELKTLVDGVIPVLLSQVVNGSTDSTMDLSSEARSVVHMGMELEKLKDFHKRVPLSDVHYMLGWFESVYGVYDNYLDVWRLGFQDLIVNLAPRSGKFDDDDSLLNALPRNEDGDVLDEDGERVNVAHLLKRPLIRVKWMTRFLKAASTTLATHEVEGLVRQYETLQEKARKRHREEIARLTDEDANQTDTTRARDLRNLAPLDSVVINQARQVAAKDSFSLDLAHSGGQRLGCQIELIHRDNPDVPADRGDVLFREIGGSALRPWLLFQPIPREKVSARIGENAHSLVVMVRGTHEGQAWHELIELSTSDNEQVIEWLNILGTKPVPPALPLTPPNISSNAATSPRTFELDVPVGERKRSRRLSSSPSSPETRPKTPSRYHGRNASRSSTPSSPTPTSARTASSDKTPTRDFSPQTSQRPLPEPPAFGPIRPSTEHLRPEPLKPVKVAPNTTPFREDGAPPPPIHRTLGPKDPTHLAPPSRVKRRTSSPLKHEYHPSDVSSDSSSTETAGSSDESDVSSDELSEDDVPDTIPGFSIKESDPSPVESSVSDNSITPSNSASQAGLPDARKPTPERMEQKFVASVSYWSEKRGSWKDVSAERYSMVVIPGGIEIHHLNASHSSPSHDHHHQTSGASDVDAGDTDDGAVRPVLALGLTPVVMIRRSTSLDLEVRGRALPNSRLKTDGFIWRFRTASAQEAKELYDAVHYGRLNNAKYIALAEEARVRAFGQMQRQGGEGSGDGDSSSQQRSSWFGRKNSYRASTRAPSQSQHSSSVSISASSFLKRLMGGNNQSFNIDRSSVDKQSRPGSVAGGLAPPASLYTSSASSSGYGGNGGLTPPRSVSASVSLSGSNRWSAENGGAKPFNPDEPLVIRCHLCVNRTQWADKGNCVLHILRPPPGVRQELSLYHGMEKRVVVTHSSKKAADGSANDQPLILLDAVLGSKCFSMLGTKGIMCSVWEDLRDEQGRVGIAPRTGGVSGHVTKWCFQCRSTQQAGFILAALTSEIPEVLLA